VRRVPIPNRYTAKTKFCFCKNNKRKIILTETDRQEQIDDEVDFSLQDTSLHCVRALLTTQTSYRALPMPMYYRDAVKASLDNLHEQAKIMVRQVQEYITEKLVDISDDNYWMRSGWIWFSGEYWQSKFITHMWNVLNDPSQIYTAQPVLCNSAMQFLAFVFKVDIDACREVFFESQGVANSIEVSDPMLVFTYDHDRPVAEIKTANEWQEQRDSADSISPVPLDEEAEKQDPFSPPVPIDAENEEQNTLYDLCGLHQQQITEVWAWPSTIKKGFDEKRG
jgi:hypothetical protein